MNSKPLYGGNCHSKNFSLVRTFSWCHFVTNLECPKRPKSLHDQETENCSRNDQTYGNWLLTFSRYLAESRPNVNLEGGDCFNKIFDDFVSEAYLNTMTCGNQQWTTPKHGKCLT